MKSLYTKVFHQRFEVIYCGARLESRWVELGATEPKTVIRDEPVTCGDERRTLVLPCESTSVCCVHEHDHRAAPATIGVVNARSWDVRVGTWRGRNRRLRIR